MSDFVRFCCSRITVQKLRETAQMRDSEKRPESWHAQHNDPVETQNEKNDGCEFWVTVTDIVCSPSLQSDM